MRADLPPAGFAPGNAGTTMPSVRAGKERLMQFRFHVSQKSKPEDRIEPWLSGAALEHQYAQLVPTLRHYCEMRGAISVTGSADPGAPWA